MAKKKQIRDLSRSAKEFPVYRELIESGGWVPHILCDTTGSYWDGCTAIDKGGQAVNGLSDAGRKQMIIMILDGCFGDKAKDAYLDQTHYWKIREALITWPNQETIQSKGLRVQELQRMPNMIVGIKDK